MVKHKSSCDAFLRKNDQRNVCSSVIWMCYYEPESITFPWARELVKNICLFCRNILNNIMQFPRGRAKNSHTYWWEMYSQFSCFLTTVEINIIIQGELAEQMTFRLSKVSLWLHRSAMNVFTVLHEKHSVISFVNDYMWFTALSSCHQMCVRAKKKKK